MIDTGLCSLGCVQSHRGASRGGVRAPWPPDSFMKMEGHKEEKEVCNVHKEEMEVHRVHKVWWRCAGCMGGGGWGDGGAQCAFGEGGGA